MEKTKPFPKSVLISESQIRERIQELGKQISKDYENQELVLVCVLRGATLFFADLAREISLPLRFEFLQTSSYHNSTESSKEIQFIRTGSDYVKHRHVLIVEDIIDTGRTLKFLVEHLGSLNPKSIKICALLDKPSRREVFVPVDYSGFEIPNVFVVGYGLDHGQLYRNLPYIAVLETISID
ncbi:MAG: hypoxanthine phosphoribosyltransferase [Candidatus Poribacteria bacterium]|nr:hypoxanthine phosphoribosyltransferase [Candidatus Poribacteria bacterium]